MQKEILIDNEQQMQEFAIQLAAKLKPNDICAINGDLGAGKSFLCRNIIQEMISSAVKVTSPTFNLLQTYEGSLCTIYHFDLYRLKYLEEIYELGIEEAFNKNICLIEWPEIIKPILPEETIYINIDILQGTKRKIVINGIA